MAYGVTPEGFNRKILQNILDELQEDQRATISPNVNTSAASPHGQLNATFARQLAEAWEALENAYHSKDPDKAVDDALVQLAKLTGTTPSGATKSLVLATVNLDNGTTLLAGVHYAAVDGNEAVRATPVEDFTASADDDYNVLFEAETAGAVRINAGTLTVISTSLAGWNSVTNALDAQVGSEADDNDALRARRERELAKAGSATAKAVAADVLAIEVNNGKPILAVTVIENDTDIEAVNGLPRHTIEVVLRDQPTVDNDIIAQAIFDSRAGGIGTAGSDSGSAADALGDGHTVYFSRPLDRPIYLTYTITYGKDYVGDDQFKANVVETMSAEHDTGNDVFQWVAALAGRQSGVKNLEVTLGFAVSPTSEDDLSIAARELATFDTSRVVVVSSAQVES
jgi:hypothetical protein